MARLPKGAEMIANPVSKAPGFRISNVYVMAGVPAIMQAMLQELAPGLTRGVPMRSATVTIRAGEGDIALGLGAIQKAHPGVVIGSYPFQADDGYAAQIVLRSRDPAGLDAALAEVRRLAGSLVSEGKARGFS